MTDIPYGFYDFSDDSDTGEACEPAALTAIDTLRRYWGYDAFRPMQAEIISSVLAGHDTIGLLPTGGGKSITLQVPALMLPGLTIVVTPLISLMKDHGRQPQAPTYKSRLSALGHEPGRDRLCL